MKQYTLPAGLLLLISLALILGVAVSMKHEAMAAAKLAASEHDLESAREELRAVELSAANAARKSEPANRFLDTWTPRLVGEASIEEIFGRLDTLAVSNLLSPSGKNFTVNSNYFFNGRQLPVQNVNITVAGDYSRTLNWLGAVEAAFPLARVEQISYTVNGNSLALAAQFVFPRKFDAP